MEFHHIAPHDADMEADFDGHKDGNANPDPPMWSEVSGKLLLRLWFIS